MKLGAATLNQIVLDWKGNTQRIVTAIEEAKNQNIELLCLPELCITGYGCEDLFLSDWLVSRALKSLTDIIENTKGIAVTLGLPLNFEGKTYNCCAFVSDQKLLGIYAKKHLANDGVHYEPRWFNSWNNGVKSIQIDNTNYSIGNLTFELNKQKIGIEICEDSWKDKNFEDRVDIILNPSASHFAFGKSEQRIQLVKDRSKKFNCTYVYSNLLGNESGRMIYDGELLIAKEGELLSRNSLLQFNPINIIANDDIIVPIESKNELFQKAVELALFDYLRKTYSKNYVLSLSGGADSSCCAILVADMVKRAKQELGENKFLELSHLDSSDTKNILITAYQGTKNSSDATFESAKELANSLHATFHHWNIDEAVTNYTSTLEKALGQSLNWIEHDIALQNIQARSRSPIIWMLTNLSKGLLITTSNRSEGDVGYTTMDGDTSGSIAPIAGVDKHFIQDWLKWAEITLGYTGLNYVNNLSPSAELRPLENTQTDEDDLMPYYLLNEIEFHAIRNWKSPVEVFQALEESSNLDKITLKNYIIKFFRLWSQNQWKRERLAPSFHLDEHNVDPRTWCRFPILNGSFKEEIADLEGLNFPQN